MSSLRLLFLGPAEFVRQDRPVVLSSTKAIAILAYLAVQRTPQTRDHLLDLFWPESFPQAARKNLRNTLWGIRKALGDNVVTAEGDRLALDSSTWVDVWEFERLADGSSDGTSFAPLEALALYRGAFLDGLTLLDAPEFEIWLTTERERLGQVYVRALMASIEWYRAQGNWREIISLAHRALTHDPLQESMHRVLMEAHARIGERSEALRQYDTARTILERELGVEPLPETEEMRAAIVEGDLQPVVTATTPPPPPSRRAPLSGHPPRSPFVGRGLELEALAAEFEIAGRGQARAVVLTGELGIGKSRLWEEWSATLPSQVTVLETRCLESTRGLPFAPLIELFQKPVCLQQLFRPDSPVPRIWLAEVARLFPEIRAALPELPPPAVLPPEGERQRLFEAFTQVLGAFGGGPLVFFIDDLHWADHATLDWLDYLVHRLHDHPLLLVAAYRREDAPSELVRLLGRWNREGITRELQISRLTDRESAELVASLGADPALAARARDQSAGNPYFLIELCRAAPGDVPPALAALILARLERLPEAARQVLQAAAVLEPEFDFAVLRRTSGRDEEETLDALDTLLEAALLVERNGRYTFSHPLVAGVVRAGLSGARRAFLHRRAAEALEVTLPERLAQLASQLATHYAEAGNRGRAAKYAEMAAERALALAAPDEAVAFYRQAVEFHPTPARQFGLGRSLMRQGDLPGARVAFDSALEGFDQQGDRRGAARTCLEIALTYLPTGQPAEVENWTARSLNYIDPETEPHAYAQVHFMIGTSRLQSGQSFAEAERHLTEAARLAATHDLPDVAARSRFELGNLFAERGDLPRALRAYQEAASFAHVAGDDFQEALSHNNLGYHALLAGDLETARTHVEIGLNLATTNGLLWPLQYLYSSRGEIALAKQEWAEAEAWFRHALDEAKRSGNLVQVANCHAHLALVARARGNLDEAEKLLRAARHTAEGLTAPHLQIQIELWTAELALESGKEHTAQEALARAEAKLGKGRRERLQSWAKEIREAASRQHKGATISPDGSNRL